MYFAGYAWLADLVLFSFDFQSSDEILLVNFTYVCILVVAESLCNRFMSNSIIFVTPASSWQYIVLPLRKTALCSIIPAVSQIVPFLTNSILWSDMMTWKPLFKVMWITESRLWLIPCIWSTQVCSMFSTNLPLTDSWRITVLTPSGYMMVLLSSFMGMHIGWYSLIHFQCGVIWDEAPVSASQSWLVSVWFRVAQVSLLSKNRLAFFVCSIPFSFPQFDAGVLIDDGILASCIEFAFCFPQCWLWLVFPFATFWWMWMYSSHVGNDPFYQRSQGTLGLHPHVFTFLAWVTAGANRATLLVVVWTACWHQFISSTWKATCSAILLRELSKRTNEVKLA